MSDNMSIKSYRGTYHLSYHSKDELLRLLDNDDNFFIIDRKISSLYPEIKQILKPERVILIDTDEEAKTIKYVNPVMANLIELGFKKNNCLVAIGGGITQDISGYISSILYRGIRWKFVPTTLLAQGDSCIGSKTSINFNGIKNVLGTFYPPENVFVCNDFLTTLPEDDIKSGIGEMLHYFNIFDLPLAQKLSDDCKNLVSERSRILFYTRKSLEYKKRLIEIDEFDKNQRRVFNYGHTFGHAIETLTANNISHGLAVILGMKISNHVSERMGFLSEEKKKTLDNILTGSFVVQCPVNKGNIGQYMSYLSKDKKNVGFSINCILMGNDGPFMYEFKDIEKLKKYILEFCNE
tara:strand:+ start:4232 stop:5284 length:1053 start_codon:yes stop_codon:yes gene_type:complete